MPKGPKFKRGFTWQHHFDEWWDRRPHEWKVRLFLWTGLALVFISVAGFLWVQRWVSREEILAEAKKIHQQRIEGSDKLLVPKESSLVSPELRARANLKARSEE